MKMLTRKILEKALVEASGAMSIVMAAHSSKFTVEVRGMAVDVMIDELERLGVEVDETMTDEEVNEMVGDMS